MTNLPILVNILIVIAIFLFVVFVTVKSTLLINRVFVVGTPIQAQNSAAPLVEVAFPYTLVQARHGPMLVNKYDFYLGRAILEYGECCEPEIIFLSSLLAYRSGIVVEIGANIGTHTIPLAKALSAEGRELVVFEPQPFLFQNLCANLALNGLTNVRAWPWACGAQQEIIFFPQPDYKAIGNFGGISMGTEASAGDVSVPCVKLDDIVGSDVVSLLKIDVEGYEQMALQGAIGVLTQSRPVLYVENDRVEKSQALIEWLWSQNYRLYWHIPHLFNEDNFFNNEENLYGRAASFNMVGLPRELDITIDGLSEIETSASHPLKK